MNLRIKSRESSPIYLKEFSFEKHDNIVLFPEPLVASLKNNLQLINQKHARFVIANDHKSSSSFLNGDNFNVNTYVDRRIPPGRDPCGNRRWKSS
ncbi:MAG: hypothetical protein QNK73_04880 [Emcibacteraceae bacterium]